KLCTLACFPALLVLPRAAGQIAGNTYYVSPAGNDANPGTQASPWRTIGKANSSLRPGDRVLIRAGTYTDAIPPNNYGTSDSQRITYQAYGDGDVMLTGWSDTGSTERGAINLAQKNYVSVIGRADSESLTTQHLVLQPPSGQVTSLVSFCGGTGNIVENIR